MSEGNSHLLHCEALVPLPLSIAAPPPLPSPGGANAVAKASEGFAQFMTLLQDPPSLEEAFAGLVQGQAAAPSPFANLVVNLSGAAQQPGESLAPTLDGLLEALQAQDGQPDPELLEALAGVLETLQQALAKLQPGTGAAAAEPLLAAKDLGARLGAMGEALADALDPHLLTQLRDVAKSLQTKAFSNEQLAQLGFTLPDPKATPLAVSPNSLLGGTTTGEPQGAAPAAKPDLVTPPKLKAEAPADAPAAKSAPPDLAELAARASTGTDAAPDAPQALPQFRIETAPAGTAQAVRAPYLAPPAQAVVPQVAFEIARQVQNGINRFEIRLDPPEMGRIDVRMDIDGAGNVHARLSVEKVETLDLMQRDQRALERALAQAGLDAGKTNLEFSLKQHQRDAWSGHQPHKGAKGGAIGAAGSGTDPTPSVTLYRGLASPGGINLFV